MTEARQKLRFWFYDADFWDILQRGHMCCFIVVFFSLRETGPPKSFRKMTLPTPNILVCQKERYLGNVALKAADNQPCFRDDQR